jgi:hypothetical protein
MHTLLLGGVLGVVQGFAATVAVNPDNAASLQWYWGDDTTNNPSPNSISLAQTPPDSLPGSIDMTMSSLTNRPFVFTNIFASQSLASITTLLYESDSLSGMSGGELLEPTLQLGIGLTPTDISFEGRLVFDPYLIPGDAPSGTGWDNWDAMTSSGGWFFSHTNIQDTAGLTAGQNDACVLTNPAPGTSYCSLASILGRIPGLTINSNTALGVVGFRTGGSGVVESSFVDNLTVGVYGVNTTFDFATTPEPSTWLMTLSAAGLIAVGARRVQVRR